MSQCSRGPMREVAVLLHLCSEKEIALPALGVSDGPMRIVVLVPAQIRGVIRSLAGAWVVEPGPVLVWGGGEQWQNTVCLVAVGVAPRTGYTAGTAAVLPPPLCVCFRIFRLCLLPSFLVQCSIALGCAFFG